MAGLTFGKIVATVKLVAFLLSPVVALVSLCLAIASFASLQSQYKDFVNVIESWQTAPFQRLVMAGASGCPVDFETLTLRVWPGTRQYCNCPDKLLLNVKCDDKQLAAGCQFVPANPPVAMTSWKQNSTICVKRVTSASDNVMLQRPFLSLETETCPDGFTACNHRANRNMTTCLKVASEEECPVTYFKMYPKSAQQPPNGTFEEAVTSPPDAPFKTYYNRTSSSFMPIIDVQVTDLKVCKQTKASQRRPGLSSISLDQIAECEIEDNRYETVDTISLYDFYTINQIPTEYMPSNANSTMLKLAFRTEVYWSRACPANPAAVKKNEDGFGGVYNSTMIVLILDILLFVFLSLIANGCKCFFQYPKNLFTPEKLSKKAKDGLMAVDCCSTCTTCCGRCCKLGVLVISIVFALLYRLFFIAVGYSYCSDPTTNDTFQFIANSIQSKVATLSFVKLVWDVFMFIVSIIMLLVLLYNAGKQAEKEKKEKEATQPQGQQ